jgi:hypothetical protein
VGQRRRETGVEETDGGHDQKKIGGGMRDELRVRERKPSSDTMLGISNLYFQEVKGQYIYICTGVENMQETPHTNGEIHNI